MGPEKNIEYQFMENYQIKYEARHGPVPAYQFRENISLHNISLERVYCRQFFSQKRNLIKFTRKTLPTFFPENNKLLPTKNTAGVALVIIGYNMGEAEKIERPSQRNT